MENLMLKLNLKIVDLKLLLGNLLIPGRTIIVGIPFDARVSVELFGI